MRPVLPILVTCLAGLAVACDDSASVPTSALELPIDFAYACEAEGGMQAPQNDETAAAINDTRMCPDVGGSQGELYGVVLDRHPPGLIVIQMNPAAGTRGFVDADFFVPGTSPIQVGAEPIQVLRAPDFSAFYVLSAGDRRIDRVVITGNEGAGVQVESSQIPLPGTPGLGLMVGDELFVAALDRAELWVVPATAGATPTLRTITPPGGGRILHMEAIPGDADSFIVTYRDRPVVARMSKDGVVLAQAGLVPACRDGLDNDGDEVADREDPDCRNMDDDDESDASGSPLVDVADPAVASFDGAAACDDGVDNDRDGLTDGDDAACDGDEAGELVPGCSDGIDNDGDGRIDGDDESCYSPLGALEGQAPADGPFHPTVIDAGDAGRFVYVLDERTGQIVVHELTAEGAFVRVDVNAEDVTPPALRSVPFSNPTGEVRESEALPAIRQPALARRGIKNIEILEGNAFNLASSRIRGELWERIIAPASPGEAPTVSFTANAAEWKPARCAPDRTDACAQPEHDDETWLLFGANLDGRLQLIEAVRRGAPIHRLAQRVSDPSSRTIDVSAPRLTLRGRLINARGEPREGYPFMGAAIEELLVERVDDESPAELRRFGIWPPADLEQAPSETWSVTYEGPIPGAGGALGRITAEGAETLTLFDAERAFCDDGVAAGDWVQLAVPIAAVDEELVHTIPVALDDGSVCPVAASDVALVEVRVASVGMSELVLDRSTVRLRPQLPVLDLDAIAAARMSRRACQQAVDDIDEVLGRPENLKTLTGLSAADLPARFSYQVRAGGVWSLVGTRSGFLHRQRWDGAACVVDEALEARLTGRLTERTGAVASYAQCPPPAEQLAYDTVEALAPAASRFENPSMLLDVFPGCERTAGGGIAAVASQQDTTFSFTITGPYQGSALSISDSILANGVPMLDFRRQQMQLDASARRASILQMRLGDPKVIATFE
ncbi:MAG: hypothetical protein IT385_19340 [Deltaproteobacteria bacterium]|nr:hypothetical protein [Deltaproteobacteria bacterium]